VNTLSGRGWGEEKAGRKRIEERGGKTHQPPHHSTLGHFILGQFLLGPSNRGQTLPVGACSHATATNEPCNKETNEMDRNLPITTHRRGLLFPD